MTTVKELLDAEDFYDHAIVRHGFTDYMRDYELLVYFGYHSEQAVHRYQFIGCVEANYSTKIDLTTFVKSLSDEFVNSGPDYPDKDIPEGFIWGVRYSIAHPGLAYIENGKRAEYWSKKLERKMHEVTIETEAFHLRLVFADIRTALVGREPNIKIPKDHPIAPTVKTSDGGVE